MDFKAINEELKQFLEISQDTIDDVAYKRREARSIARDNYILGKGSKETYQQSIDKLNKHNELANARLDRLRKNATWPVYICFRSALNRDEEENASYVLANGDYEVEKINDDNMVRLTLKLAKDNEDILSLEDAINFWKQHKRFIGFGRGENLSRFGINNDRMNTYMDVYVYIDTEDASKLQQKGLQDKQHKEEVQEKFKQFLSTAKVTNVELGKFRSYATYSSNGETVGTYDLVFKNTGLTADFFINENTNLLQIANEWVKNMPTPDPRTIYSSVRTKLTGNQLLDRLCDAKITKTKVTISNIDYTDVFIGD